MSQPSISLVIPVQNLRGCVELTDRALRTLRPASGETEIVFVDDGSTDGTAEYLTDRGHTVLKNPCSLGRAATRNVGWRHSTGEFVVFLDGDMLPSPSLLQAYETAFVSDIAPDVVSGSRHCLDCDPRCSDLMHFVAESIGVADDDLFRTSIDEQFSRLSRLSQPAQYPDPLFLEFERQLRIVCERHTGSIVRGYSLVTSNCGVRRSLLEATAGFDSGVRRAEDTDLGIRIAEMGGRFVFAEEGRAWHLNDCRQADRPITPIDRQAFLLRNPYREVVLVYLWASLSNTPVARCPLPLDSGLVQIASDATRLWTKLAPLYSAIIPATFDVPEDALLTYLHETAAMPIDNLTSLLDGAVRNGLVFRADNGARSFDIHHTSNWLNRRTPLYEYVMRHSSYAYNSPTALQRGDANAASKCVRYAGSYTAEFGDAPPGLVANIALPVPHRCQTELSLVSFHPSELAQCADLSQGTLRVPLASTAELDGRICYKFTCAVHERPTAVGDTPRDLTLIFPQAAHPKLAALFERIRHEYGDSPKAIYEWIVGNIRYCSTSQPDYAVLDTWAGTCVHQSRLFVNLCRLTGVAAVEQSGALLVREDHKHRCIGRHTLGHGPFDHTWAEYLDDSGVWRPVEFISRGYSEHELTPLNVLDGQLRRRIAERSPTLMDYYFGCNDPFRIYSGPGSRLPPFSTEDGKPNVLAIRSALMNAHHKLTCQIVEDS
jgi:glycosyltransferase involved in cell wall biosynthesis